MLIYEVKETFSRQGVSRLKDCLKHSRTLAFRRKCEHAKSALDVFFSKVKNPVVSCGGGKDSTATAILARQVLPNVTILCADPPNPLSDRNMHVDNLQAWLSGNFIRIPYDWDVNEVLSGNSKYPEGLKMRVLTKYHRDNRIDGVVLGIRTSESKSRRLVYKSKGQVYKTENGWRCLPVATFSAEEVLCVAMLQDAPINPVYTRQRADISFEIIRDGTWWPHGIVDISQWIREYYPEHYENHIKAIRIYDASKSRVCMI